LEEVKEEGRINRVYREEETEQVEEIE